MKTKSFFITRWIIAIICLAILNAWFLHAYFNPHELPKIHTLSPIDFMKQQQSLYQHSFLWCFIESIVFGAIYMIEGAVIVWLLGFLVPRKSKTDAPEISR